MKVGTILTATDMNPTYCEFIPNFVTAWKKLVPEADICIVMIADEIPEKYQAYAEHIKLFAPLDGMKTAFQAQCIRLFYPRQIGRDEGVLITDMDMIPMRRSYYIDSIENISSDNFVVYRDGCLPDQISMCYNIAHPKVWESLFGSASTEDILKEWYSKVSYDGSHAGAGWSTDQIFFAEKFHAWDGCKIILNDKITRFDRLDRFLENQFTNRMSLYRLIREGMYADYHCHRPYSAFKEINDFIVNCL